jgi:hypothetical protein
VGQEVVAMAEMRRGARAEVQGDGSVIFYDAEGKVRYRYPPPAVVRAQEAREAAAAAGGFYVEPEHMEALAELSAAQDDRGALRCIGYVRSLVLRWRQEQAGQT